jgi:hypothetical protein
MSSAIIASTMALLKAARSPNLPVPNASRSSRAYSIPQEEEMADAKRPDLRFHGVGIDAPVPVELKIADNWTGPKLFERLENQLAGDYLRDIRTGRGVFALVHRGVEKGGWQLPGSKTKVNFDGLVDALGKHWLSLAPKYPGVDEITIVGIDLSKRGA